MIATQTITLEKFLKGKGVTPYPSHNPLIPEQGRLTLSFVDTITHTIIRRFCEVPKEIAGFYLSELALLGKSPKNSDYNNFKSYAERLILFALAALRGELRHAYHKTDEGKVQRAAKKSLKQAGLGYLHIPKNNTVMGRNLIYMKASKRSEWRKIIDVSADVFYAKMWGGDSSFGGAKWGECADATGELLDAVDEGVDIKKLILKTDRLINICHNNSAMLTKFNCDTDCTGMLPIIGATRGLWANIFKALEAHEKGNIMVLEAIRGLSCTNSMGCGLTIKEEVDKNVKIIL